MPSATSAATAGRTIRSSSSPIAPCSPACGLSPATARRGFATPKRRRSSPATMRPVSTIRSSVSASATSRERNMDGDRHRPQLRPGQHHHRLARPAGPRGRQGAEELGMPGMLEAGIVERLLVDRIGDQRGGGPGAHVADRPGDRLDHRRGVGAVRRSGFGGDRRFQRQYRQRTVETGRRVGGRHRLDRAIDAERSRASGEQGGVGEAIEDRQRKLATTAPRGQRDVRSDARRFAHREGKRWKRHACLPAAWPSDIR